MTSSQRGPLMPWATHMIQWVEQWVAKPRGGANPIKSTLNSDWRLQLASMKPESLVIADQHAAVNTFSSLALGSPCDYVNQPVKSGLRESQRVEAKF